MDKPICGAVSPSVRFSSKMHKSHRKLVSPTVWEFVSSFNLFAEALKDA